MDSGANHQSLIIGLEFMLVFLFGALALGCVKEWLTDWRHDPQGRIFFTLLTGGSIILVLGLLASALHGMGVL